MNWRPWFWWLLASTALHGPFELHSEKAYSVVVFMLSYPFLFL